MIYVLPVPEQLRGQLLPYARLYAFPTEPEPPAGDKFIILDSGAFGLSQAGKRMDSDYIQRLKAHYQRFQADNVLCIAPDEYLSPSVSVARYLEWDGPAVVPVLQFARARKLDATGLFRQLSAYAPFAERLPRYQGRPVVALSNPGLYADEVAPSTLAFICSLIRRTFPNAWIHMLGAGWNIQDIRGWAARPGGFDSMDSIAYYTAAQAGEAWRDRGQDWRETALYNAQAAVDVAARWST